jgi:hypothetical protein
VLYTKLDTPNAGITHGTLRARVQCTTAAQPATYSHCRLVLFFHFFLYLTFRGVYRLLAVYKEYPNCLNVESYQSLHFMAHGLQYLKGILAMY